jgi:hypothetical protein
MALRESIIDTYIKLSGIKRGCNIQEMQENTITTMNKILFQSARNVATNKMPIDIYGSCSSFVSIELQLRVSGKRWRISICNCRT